MFIGGRFALRNRLAKTCVIDDPGELLDLLENYQFDVNTISEINADVMLVTYTPKEEYVVENPSSNLCISIFTTAYAR